ASAAGSPALVDRNVVGAAAAEPSRGSTGGASPPPPDSVPGAMPTPERRTPPPAPLDRGPLDPPATGGPAPLAHTTHTVAEGSSTRSTPMPTRIGQLPGLRIVNKRQVKLEFEVAKFGPSGLGSVDVYVTEDEGGTWEKTPGTPDVTLPVAGDIKAGTTARG